MANRPNIFEYSNSFQLECGAILPKLDLGYTVAGKLNREKDNVIWVCHALTANSDPSDWWPGMVGKERLFNPEQHFIICCNMLGSCYGSSGPLSLNPEGAPYGKHFPVPTIRDNVKAQKLLLDHLGIKKIKIVLGGSMGGQQALEWSLMFGDYVEHAALIACSAAQSPWARALNATQRMALEADQTWNTNDKLAGVEGMKAARAIALLSYRSFEIYGTTQRDEDRLLLENYRADSYQRYQGEKLAKRFIPASYYIITKTMDSHDIGRGRGEITEVLKKIKSKIIVVGISSDVLFPIEEQKFLARNIDGALYKEIHSSYGHDGFLVEFAILEGILKDFLGNKI
jgi:homoserine O-acetyltransferase/O-succinyltransferase